MDMTDQQLVAEALRFYADQQLVKHYDIARANDLADQVLVRGLAAPVRPPQRPHDLVFLRPGEANT